MPSTLTWCAVIGENSARVESSAARCRQVDLELREDPLEERPVGIEPMNSR